MAMSDTRDEESKRRLPDEVLELWRASAARGNPPSFRQVYELEYGKSWSWHIEEAYGDLPTRIDPNGQRKSKVFREMSRGSSKTVTVNCLRLYVAEWLAPYWKRDGLPIDKVNRGLVLFGRDQTHIREEILTPLKDLIVNYAPWLRSKDWKGIIEDHGEGEGQRRLADMKSKGAQKWEAYRIDLSNGITIKSRTIRQSARGLHLFYGDFDDVLTEENVAQSEEILSMIDGALMPAIEPGGMVLWQGTPQGLGDVSDMILQREDWDRLQFPAQDVDGSRGYREKNRAWIGPSSALLDDAHLSCLWPARITPAVLEDARGKTRETELKFLREWMLQRVTNDTALVHPEDIAAAKDTSRSYHHKAEPGFSYGGGLDPSGRRRDDAAFCLGIATKEGIRIPLHFKMLGANPHMAPGEGELSVVSELNDLSKRFLCYNWFVEANGFQSIIIGLQRRMDPSVRCEPFDLGANKHTERGWKKVRTIFQSRMVRLPYRTEEDRRITDAFLHQLRGLQIINGEVVEDKGRKNDLVSAFFLFLLATDNTTSEVEFSAIPLPSPLPLPTDRPSFLRSPASSLLGHKPSGSAELDTSRPSVAHGGLSAVRDRLSRAQSLRRRR